MRSNDPRMRAVLPPELIQGQARPARAVPAGDAIEPTGLQTRVVGTAEWQARAKQIAAAGGEPTPPAEHEIEVIVTVRGIYALHSDLVPPEQWPAVELDLLELGRVNLVDLKSKVHAHLAKESNAFAERVKPKTDRYGHKRESTGMVGSEHDRCSACGISGPIFAEAEDPRWKQPCPGAA